MDDHPPTLASIWELGTADFSIVAWPPKHCAAVHVLFIESRFKGRGLFHVVPEMATSPTVKFYPPIGKVEISADGTTFETLYNLRSSIHFKHVSASSYTVELSTQHVDKQKEFESGGDQKKEVALTLESRMALILTNSRYCFAHIVKKGRNSEYSQLFDRETYQDKANLPKVLTRYEEATGFPSLFMPLVTEPSTKSVDLLPVLQKPDFHPPGQMRQAPVCNGFRSASRNPLKRQIGVISVDSWTGAMKNLNLQDNRREEQFYIDIGKECSWIRLWITDQTKEMSKYEMVLDETIDIFFDQQFFVGPDSDEARPLSGNSTQIDRIEIRRHWDGNPLDQPHQSKKRIVQMSYGRGAGPALTYIEYFHLPSLHRSDFKVHLIKAPKCEANLVTSGDTIKTQSANRARVNTIQFKQCVRSLLKNTNTDDLMASDVEDLKKAELSEQ